MNQLPEQATDKMIQNYSIDGEDLETMPTQLFTNAREELLWRLNEWWNGRHPGRPVNWKGLG